MQIAAIDIGSNSVHMIVVRVRPDLSFEVIDREKEMVRLGAGGRDGRRLTQSSMDAAVRSLATFKRLADVHDVQDIVATATSAVRGADNGGDFAARIHRDVGIRVRVISGAEEARLIHLAAAYAAGVGSQPAVVIDIGGGSVEVTFGTAARMQLGGSFPLGVIRLTEALLEGDPVTAASVQALEDHVRLQTASHIHTLKTEGFDRVIGTSGTILALGALAAGSNADLRNRRVSAKALRKVRRALTGMTLQERLNLPGLDSRRADLAVAGAVILDTLLNALEASELTLCDFALREGLILDYISNNATHIRTANRVPDARRRSVLELAERCHYIAPHAEQVARLSLSLFDALQPVHGLGAPEREWLEYAALLHDIGALISFDRHHKHSQYLILHGDLRGFEPDEVSLIALVARYHRQSPPNPDHRDFSRLSGSQKKVVAFLGAIVRLAEGLDRSHAQVIVKIEVVEAPDGVVVRLRTNGPPELELWAAPRHAAPLEAILGRSIRFDASAM